MQFNMKQDPMTWHADADKRVLESDITVQYSYPNKEKKNVW